MISNIDATPAPRWQRQRSLPVGASHHMAWHTGGNPQGAPWLLLHGGPGSGASPGLTAPLALAQHWAIAPDQRGSGASRPRGSVRRNTTAALVADLEQLRAHLGVQRWSVLAGSWGTVLALAYAQAHPQRVAQLVLRGAFAVSPREVGGLLQGHGYGKTPSQRTGITPRAGRMAQPALLCTLCKLLQSETPGVAALNVARRWAWLEARAATAGLWRALRQAPGNATAGVHTIAARRAAWATQHRRLRQAQVALHRSGPRMRPPDRALWAKFRIQSHYLRHRGFVRPGQLNTAVTALARQGVPVHWVHGRVDPLCPPANSRRWAAMGQRAAPGPGAPGSLTLTSAGHLGHEPATLAALRAQVRQPDAGHGPTMPK